MKTTIYKRTKTPNGFTTKEINLNQETFEAILEAPSELALTNLIIIDQNKHLTLREYIEFLNQPKTSKPIKRISDTDRAHVIEMLNRGLSCRKIENKTNISKSSIARIKQSLN